MGIFFSAVIARSFFSIRSNCWLDNSEFLSFLFFCVVIVVLGQPITLTSRSGICRCYQCQCHSDSDDFFFCSSSFVFIRSNPLHCSLSMQRKCQISRAPKFNKLRWASHKFMFAFAGARQLVLTVRSFVRLHINRFARFLFPSNAKMMTRLNFYLV